MRKLFKPLAAATTALGLIWAAPHAAAFCGFYVAKADANLFNEASKVVMARDGDRTVITMVNDYQGDPTEFAMVVPTPVVLQESQINIGKKATVDHLDAYTAPRLVEYHDPDPCREPEYRGGVGALTSAMAPMAEMAMADSAAPMGVTIEAEYTIGEYDILILSAEQSDGLQRWLDQEGYNVPPKARDVLASYIAQDMKFFVAKVNLEEKAKIGGEFLRPIQLAFEHDRFMLPIRLGTVNAKDKQDLILYTLTRKGRVESTNYRTAKIPTDMDLPLFLKDGDEFGEFYKAMYAKTAEREGPSTILEYAWDMNWCDPCAADPLSQEQLRSLGAFWIGKPGIDANGNFVQPRGGQARDAFVTRLHVRYDAASFPEDLKFQETGDRNNFQGRYVMRNPFEGDLNCPAGAGYAKRLQGRFEKEATQLASITGWDVTDIRKKMRENGQIAPDIPKFDPKPWWETIWD